MGNAIFYLIKVSKKKSKSSPFHKFLLITIVSMFFSCISKQLKYVPVERHVTSTIISNNDSRSFTYFVPEGYSDSKLPLLFVLHGGGGSDKGMMYLTRLSDFAESYGFIVVYAQGYANRWNDGRNLNHSITDQRNTNDVQYFKDLRKHFIENFSIDKTRIAVVGLSNGGFMTTKLACSTNGEFTHFISVAGGMSKPVLDRCTPPRPQKMLFISGKKDEVIPFDGGHAFTYSKDGRIDLGLIVPFHETLEFWSSNNKCALHTKELFIDEFSKRSDKNYSYLYTDCTGDLDIEGIAIERGDHSWPHGFFYANKNKFGYLNTTMDASMKIVKFIYNLD